MNNTQIAQFLNQELKSYVTDHYEDVNYQDYYTAESIERDASSVPSMAYVVIDGHRIDLGNDEDSIRAKVWNSYFVDELIKKCI